MAHRGKGFLLRVLVFGASITYGEDDIARGWVEKNVPYTMFSLKKT